MGGGALETPVLCKLVRRGGEGRDQFRDNLFIYATHRRKYYHHHGEGVKVFKKKTNFAQKK